MAINDDALLDANHYRLLAQEALRAAEEAINPEERRRLRELAQDHILIAARLATASAASEVSKPKVNDDEDRS
jgi:hypothetical protein